MSALARFVADMLAHEERLAQAATTGRGQGTWTAEAEHPARWGGHHVTDVVRLAWDLGLSVLTADLDPGVGAILVKRPGQSPHLTIARGEPASMKLACGHALSLYWRNEHRDDYGFIIRDGHLFCSADEESERANRFARALTRDEVT